MVIIIMPDPKLNINYRHLLFREKIMRYSQVLETFNDVDQKRRAAEIRNNKYKTATKELTRAKNEDDPALRSAKIQSANAKKREADARFRKTISENEHFYDELPPFPNPGRRSMTEDEMNALMCRINIVRSGIMK